MILEVSHCFVHSLELYSFSRAKRAMIIRALLAEVHLKCTVQMPHRVMNLQKWQK